MDRSFRGTLPFLMSPFLALHLFGCQNATPSEGAFVPPPLAAAPQGTPAFSVLVDKVSPDRDDVEVRVALSGDADREGVDALLRHLYRQVMTRLGIEPLGVAAYVYRSAADQAKDPEKSFLGSVVKKRGDLGPTFDNRVPLSFPKQVAAVLSKDTFTGKRKLQTEIHEIEHAVVLTVPFVEPGEDHWRRSLSFGAAVAEFFDYADRLYDKVPALQKLTFVGMHEDDAVLRVEIASRAQFESLGVRDMQERIGAQQGRAFAQLSLGRMSDAAVSKDKAARAKKVYRETLGRLPKTAVALSKKLI